MMIRLFLVLFFVVNTHVSWAEEVSFTTADSAIIYANFQQRGPHAVLLAHGAIFNKDSWGEFEQQLLADNFSVLAIDFRGYNKSTQGHKVQALYEDVLAGVRFLRKQPGVSKVSVLGASMGAKAAAKANVYSQPKEIDQLILLSPPRVYQPEKLKGQLLFIASKDEYVAKIVKSAYIKAPEPKTLELIDGRAHAQHIFKTSQAKLLTSIIINFLKNSLPVNSE